MTSEVVMDDEYREIELYLRQAQEEIGQALSNLETTGSSLESTNKDQGTVRDPNNPQDPTHTQEDLNNPRDPGDIGRGFSTWSTSLSKKKSEIPDNARGNSDNARDRLNNARSKVDGAQSNGVGVGEGEGSVVKEGGVSRERTREVDDNRGKEVSDNRGDGSPRDVNANRADLTAVSGHPDNDEKCTLGSAPNLQTVDFLSIFAQNDLLEDNSDILIGRSQPDCWNFTLPNPRKRPSRPKTLTPPPRLQVVSNNPFKNQDWRSYVRGEFGFQPIQTDVDNNQCNTRENRNPKCASTYIKPKPKNPYVSSVKDLDDVEAGYVRHTGVSRQRSASAPVRPIPTKPQLGVRLGAQAITAHRKITFDTSNKSNGFQRPRSMNDARVGIGVTPMELPLALRGAASASNIDDIMPDKLAVQTENVVESLPSIRSPTIERKNINFPNTKAEKLKDNTNRAGDRMKNDDVKNSMPNVFSKEQEGAVQKLPGGMSGIKKPSSKPSQKKEECDVAHANAKNCVNGQGPCVQTPKLSRSTSNTHSVKKVSSTATRHVSPTRTAQPALAIPPPPKVEDPPRSSKVVIRQPSPEKQHWQHQPRSRSNSGSEIDLAISRTERRTQSAFEKVSTSTQTDKRAERRRKSDPGFLSRGLLKAARTKYMGTPAYIKPSKLDTDNNNIQTAVVKPMKPVMGNKQASLNRHIHNDKKSTDLNKNCSKKSSSRSSKTSTTDIVVVANHSQEGQRNGDGDSRNDITVQVEVFVSCTDNERTDPKSRNYYDSAGRAWARERRVSAKPLMPVIAEVQKGSGDDDSGSDTEAFDSSTSSSTQSQRGGYTRSLSSAASNSDGVPSPDGPAPPLPPRQVRVRPKKLSALKIRAPLPELTGVSGKRRSAPTPPGSPMPRSPRSPLSSTSSSGSAVSLLDSLHRRYYPGMYNPQCPNTRHSNPEMGTASAGDDLVPHSKSASFADDKFPETSRYHRPRAGSTPEQLSEGGVVTARIEMLSEEKTQRMAELLAQLAAPPPSDGSTIGSSAGSPCSTLSPPTLHRLRPGGATFAAGHHDSSEAESSYGSLSSAKGVEVPTASTACKDTCPAAIDQTLQSVKSERELAEIEAVEACKWLRAAGFPQYAQMYEDQLFPIDIASVENDHDFLDTDSIQSLFRRLNTLNKCANMKIEAPPRKSGDESDEEEQCALSDRWRFQRSSRRWSRRDLDDLLPASCNQHHLLPNPDDSMDKSGLRSCSSHDSVLTDTEPSLTHLDDSPLLHTRSTHRHGSVPDSPSYAHPAGGTTLLVPPPGGGAEKSERRSMSPISPRLRRAASERFRGAKIFLKRIESFKTKKSKKKPGTTGAGGRVEISGPVVVDSSAFQERMDRLGCVEISPTSETPPPSSPFSGADSLSSHQSQRSPQITGDLSLSPNTHGPLRLCHSTASGISSEPMHQHLVLSKQASASVVGGGLSPVNKRDGRVFLDSSSSFPSGSSTLSDSHSEDPLHILEQLVPPAGAAHTSGHRRNHSSSDIMDMYSGGNNPNQQLKQGSSPLLVSNGYIDVGNGSQINYRTGSFNMGCESAEDYKEGIIRRTTAKRAVADSSGSSPQHQGAAGCSGDTAGGQKQRENRLSIYDNVPVSTESANAQHELDMILHDLFENINGLSQSLGQCMNDENTATDSEVKSGVVQPSPNTTTTTAGSDSDQYDTAMPPAIHGTDTLQEDKPPTAPLPPLVGADSTTHHPHYQQRAPAPLPMAPVEDQDVASASSSTHEMSDGDTAGSREEDGSDQPESARERRDSGVGSSLTRAPSDRRRHRIRWHSFVKSHRPSLTSRSLQICNMSAGQLMVLRKLSLLKVTALMEKYSPTNRSGWNWIMPKFIKRFKVPDYKDKQVFGVPLLVVLQRTGQPLPQCILYAMRSLRRTARDAVGIFRKSGVRSRIQKLHNQIESNPECMDFDQLQAYDVADLLKQYFRELPECLLTNKLSETFIASFTHVPPELRLDALQAAVMLLPDENREVLQSLLLFLSDMAEHASENQMTASNLAVCFAPSLFHMCGPRNNPAASPKRNRKNMGIPDQKDLLEQKAAHECLTAMITDCKSIFSVPEEMLSKCRLSYIEQGDPVSIEELMKRRTDSDVADHTAYMESCIQGLLRESHNKFKGWMSVSSAGSTDAAYKKVGDGHPLRLWKCAVDVEAPPIEVLNRVLHERHLWDEDLLKWRVVEKLDAETDVFQYVLNNMAPHPTRDFTELRSWRTNLPKGACVLVSTSVEHPEANLIGGIRAVVLASRYLIEPCGSGKSRLTHMCRIDLRGHTPEWYNKAYGHLCANYVMRIRDSFKQDIDSTAGPETKV